MRQGVGIFGLFLLLTFSVHSQDGIDPIPVQVDPINVQPDSNSAGQDIGQPGAVVGEAVVDPQAVQMRSESETNSQNTGSV